MASSHVNIVEIPVKSGQYCQNGGRISKFCEILPAIRHYRNSDNEILIVEISENHNK